MQNRQKNTLRNTACRSERIFPNSGKKLAVQLNDPVIKVIIDT